MPPKSPRFLQLPWRSRANIARDVDTELSFHLESRIAELTAEGVGADEARRRAREEFGDLEFTRAYCRAVDERGERATRLADRLADWRQDARYAFRTLRRSPGFAAVSLLTLALAIGANTSIFSVARAVLLKPLPYGDPGTLIALFENWPDRPGEHTTLSPANFADWRAQQRTFTDIAAYEPLADVVRARKQHYVQVIGRLKPDQTITTAGADLQLIAARLAAQYPDADSGRSAVLIPLHDLITGNLRRVLLLLQGAALMVLLIACANLANLTLSRTMGRRREMALRAALGAGRGRLVRQLLTESVMLAVFGGALGIALAIVATRALLALNHDTMPAMFAAGGAFRSRPAGCMMNRTPRTARRP